MSIFGSTACPHRPKLKKNDKKALAIFFSIFLAFVCHYDKFKKIASTF